VASGLGFQSPGTSFPHRTDHAPPPPFRNMSAVAFSAPTLAPRVRLARRATTARPVAARAVGAEPPTPPKPFHSHKFR